MDERLPFLFAVTAIVFALCKSKAIPLHNSVNPEVESARESELVDYLVKYGYLTRPDPRIGELMTHDEIIAAVKKLQRVAGYKETGDISNAKTLSIVKRKRCGMADFGPSDNARRKRRYALHGTSWNKLDLTYRIENYTPDLSKEDVDRTIEKALEIWSNASGLTFKREDDFTVEPDISIKFVLGYHGDGRPTDGPGKELAHAFFPLDNKGIAGDLHFDEDETFTLNGEGGTDLLWLAVHELGHSLGLEHTFFPDSIMFPYYLGYQPNLQLDSDDVQAIQALYGLPQIERPTPIPNTGSPSPTDGSPNKCNVKLDAIVMTADETTYAFSGNYFWEIGDYGAGEAKEIKAFWPDLEENIDAAYTIRSFGHTIFFKGDRYWVYQNQKKFYGPADISELGIPKELANMDAALEWRRNGKAYFFKGDDYWRYDRTRGEMDDGYPKKITVWKGIPENIDSVFQWKNGRSYFFKGNDYYAFDDDKLKVLEVEESKEKPYPRDLGTYWMGCSEQKVVLSPDRSAACGLLPNAFMFVFALTVFLTWIF